MTSRVASILLGAFAEGAWEHNVGIRVVAEQVGTNGDSAGWARQELQCRSCGR
jgi:hypothetical protein